MNSSQQALQINGKLFSNFGFILRISYNFFLNNSSVWVYASEMREAFVLK